MLATRRLRESGLNMATAPLDSVVYNQFIHSVDLLDLHQVSTETSRGSALDKGHQEFEIHTTRQFKWQFNEERRGLIALMKIEAKGSVGDLEAIRIQAVYRAIYQVRETFTGEITPQIIDAFCNSSFPGQVWPYWREFLAEASYRMNAPRLLAPLFIYGPPPAKHPAAKSAHARPKNASPKRKSGT